MSQYPDSSPDPDYYVARAVEERRLAMAAKDAKVRAIRLELAERYDILARSGGLEPPHALSEEQRAG
jgi:hypothetical protein